MLEGDVGECRGLLLDVLVELPDRETEGGVVGGVISDADKEGEPHGVDLTGIGAMIFRGLPPLLLLVVVVVCNVVVVVVSVVALVVFVILPDNATEPSFVSDSDSDPESSNSISISLTNMNFFFSFLFNTTFVLSCSTSSCKAPRLRGVRKDGGNERVLLVYVGQTRLPTPGSFPSVQPFAYP